jgi:hypothetical protein
MVRDNPMYKDNMKTMAAMRRSLMKRIVLLSLSGFFLAIIAVAFHYHDDTFLLRSRSICQARAAISGTISKNQVDSAPAVTVVYFGLASVSPLWAPVVHKNSIIFISSQAGYICPNKAPPARS